MASEQMPKVTTDKDIELTVQKTNKMTGQSLTDYLRTQNRLASDSKPVDGAGSIILYVTKDQQIFVIGGNRRGAGKMKIGNGGYLPSNETIHARIEAEEKEETLHTRSMKNTQPTGHYHIGHAKWGSYYTALYVDTSFGTLEEIQAHVNNIEPGCQLYNKIFGYVNGTVQKWGPGAKEGFNHEEKINELVGLYTTLVNSQSLAHDAFGSADILRADLENAIKNSSNAFIDERNIGDYAEYTELKVYSFDNTLQASDDAVEFKVFNDGATRSLLSAVSKEKILDMAKAQREEAKESSKVSYNSGAGSNSQGFSPAPVVTAAAKKDDADVEMTAKRSTSPTPASM